MDHGLGAFLAGAIALRESVSKATLENALEWLVDQGLLAEANGAIALRDQASVRSLVERIAGLLAA
jgi:glycerol-3-phosphate O-acyltransferase